MATTDTRLKIHYYRGYNENTTLDDVCNQSSEYYLKSQFEPDDIEEKIDNTALEIYRYLFSAPLSLGIYGDEGFRTIYGFTGVWTIKPFDEQTSYEEVMSDFHIHTFDKSNILSIFDNVEPDDNGIIHLYACYFTSLFDEEDFLNSYGAKLEFNYEYPANDKIMVTTQDFIGKYYGNMDVVPKFEEGIETLDFAKILYKGSDGDNRDSLFNVESTSVKVLPSNAYREYLETTFIHEIDLYIQKDIDATIDYTQVYNGLLRCVSCLCEYDGAINGFSLDYTDTDETYRATEEPALLNLDLSRTPENLFGVMHELFGDELNSIDYKYKVYLEQDYEEVEDVQDLDIIKPISDGDFSIEVTTDHLFYLGEKLSQAKFKVKVTYESGRVDEDFRDYEFTHDTIDGNTVYFRLLSGEQQRFTYIVYVLKSISVTGGPSEYEEGDYAKVKSYSFVGTYEDGTDKKTETILYTKMLCSSESTPITADQTELTFYFLYNNDYSCTKSITVTPKQYCTVKFLGYHEEGKASKEFLIDEQIIEVGERVTAPEYTGEEGYEFYIWDFDITKRIYTDVNIHALCKPTWDTLLSLTDDELESMRDSDTYNGGEFKLLLPNNEFREKVCNATRPYLKQETAKVGSSYESSMRKSELIPFNPEKGETNDEAAANSIINVKNLEIVFKPKKFVDETKEFVQNKVMPYLTAMIPSTTIFSYKFDGEEDDIELKTPKIVYYEADDDNLSSDERVIIDNTKAIEIEFDAIVDDAKTYHIKVDSMPTDYTVNLKIVGSPSDWISVKRDSLGDGFLISVLSDNYSETEDTKARTVSIEGLLQTIEDENYDGTASVNVNIICTQNGYTHTSE